MPITLSPFSLEELSMLWINDHRGSWMKRVSKSLLISNKVSVRDLFFWTFCKKNLEILHNYI